MKQISLILLLLALCAACGLEPGGTADQPDAPKQETMQQA